MKTRLFAISLFFCTFLIVPGAIAGYFPEQAIAAAEAFTRTIDQQDSARAYAETSELLQIKTSQSAWIEQQQVQQKLLGKVVERRLVTLRKRDSFPGFPDGEYLVVSYQTQTKKKAEATELLLLHQEENGWKVCEYSIR